MGRSGLGHATGSPRDSSPYLQRVPLDAAVIDDETIDPYSARVIHVIDRVGPAVAHIRAVDRAGRALGIGAP